MQDFTGFKIEKGSLWEVWGTICLHAAKLPLNILTLDEAIDWYFQ